MILLLIVLLRINRHIPFTDIFPVMCWNELDDLCTKIKIKLIRADVSKQSWQALIFIINTKILNHLIIYTKKWQVVWTTHNKYFTGFFQFLYLSFRNFAAYIFVILRFSTHSDNIILIIFNFIYIIKVIKIWTLRVFFLHHVFKHDFILSIRRR